MRGRANLSLWVLCALLSATGAARASSVTYDYNTVFSGQAPGGPSPWIVATFTDISPGDVRLTINTLNLVQSENVTAVYFNVDPNLDPTKLAFTSDNGGTGTIAASISLGNDMFKADGDGKYDILFNYPTSGAFNKSMTSTYDITDPSAAISAASFYFLSTPAGGHGPFYSSIHVQNATGVGSGGSGWVAPVPLPAAAWLLASGLGGLGAFARKKRRA